MRIKIMPTTLLLVAILLCIVLHWLVPIAYIMPTPWNLLGIILMLFGMKTLGIEL